MKKSVPNQNCVPSWDTTTSDSYIRECYKIYQEKWRAKYSIGDIYYGPHECRYYSSVKFHYTGTKADWMLIESLYREGRSKKVLACDYSSFADYLINGYQRKWTRYSYLKAPFRHKHNDVKWKEKGKKTLSDKEQSKRDWREHTQVDKDNKKASYRRGPGKWYKKYSQKLHRSWQKTNIHNEDWEELLDTKKIKYFCDPWLWS